MNKFLIIDGLNLTRRIYAAAPDELNMETLALRVNGACNKLLKFHQPTHVAIVWDGNEESWRKKLYPDYKKGRKPMPEALANGLNSLKNMLANHNLFSINASSEADDVIATLATKMALHNGQAIIVSTDKGFCQLEPKNIKQWDHFSQQYFDIEALENKLGIECHQLLDFFALAGDSGNKIPGITGIGPKSASELLKSYRTLANIYASIDTLGEKQAKKLADGKEMARLSYKLAKLKTDIKLNIKLSEFRVISESGTHINI